VKSNLVEKITLNLFLFVLVAISPVYNIDSISLPKFVLLASYGFIGLTYILFNLPQFANKLNLIVKIISLGLIFCIFISFISSQSPKEQLIFGRDGRYNGTITFVALVILFVISSTISLNKSSYLTKSIVTSVIIIVLYSIMQLLNLDPIKWDTVNIKYFGTFGNPNFLSSFLAISVIPLLAFMYKKLKNESIILKIILYIIVNTIAIYLIYKTFSIQGFVVLFLTNIVWLAFWFYSKNKIKFLYLTIFTALISSYLGIIGTLNKGPLANLLYKSSITSRGDFYRSAIEMTKENWEFGVGADSFGDYYLMYRDVTAANRINAELADSAHNYFLDISASFGVFMLIIYLFMIVMTFISFTKIYTKTNYDQSLLVLFIIWSGLIIQSLISPLNLAFLVYIFLFSGLILGNRNYLQPTHGNALTRFDLKSKYPTIVGLFCALIVINPLVQRDHAILVANNAKRLDSLLLAIEQYPKSTTSYNKVLVILDSQSDKKLLLLTARKAANFNMRSSAAQMLIFNSTFSSKDEKTNALKQLIALDPKNSYFDKILIK
jgi:O-antigen ligase